MILDLLSIVSDVSDVDSSWNLDLYGITKVMCNLSIQVVLICYLFVELGNVH